MYRHANANIHPSHSSDHDSESTRSSERQRKQIPLAFTNTCWGREYASNLNWEHENLGRNNPAVRQGSRFRPEPVGKDNKLLPTQIKSPNALEIGGSSAFSSPSTTTNSSTTSEVSQGYSVMKAWGFFSRSFSSNASPSSADGFDAERRKTVHLETEGGIETGPWLEMLMRWDDFEQWRLKVLSRSWYLPSTP